MPIKGMTDAVTPRFPSLGKLRKGDVTTKVRDDGKVVTYPIDLEYFRFTSDNPAVKQKFDELFGEKPTLLYVYLPYRTAEENFSAWREEWSAGGLIHRCDGETMTTWRTAEGKYSQEQRPCPYFTGEKKRAPQAHPPQPGCVQVGRLEIIIPELVQAGHVGFVTFETHSINDIVDIMASLKQTEAARAKSPHGLRGVRFALWRRMEQVSTPAEAGKRVRRKKWMVQIMPAADWVQVQFQLSASPVAGELPAGDADKGGEDAIEDEAGVGDVVEGECTEAQAGANDAQPAPATDERPYLPEKVKAKMAATVAAGNGQRGKSPDAKAVGLMAGKLSEALGGGQAGTQGRHLALQYLFGKQSSNDLDAAEVNAVLRWLVGQRDENTGAYPLIAPAVEELKRIVTAAQAAAGQEMLL
jgi:hypothetical protein